MGPAQPVPSNSAYSMPRRIVKRNGLVATQRSAEDCICRHLNEYRAQVLTLALKYALFLDVGAAPIEK